MDWNDLFGGVHTAGGVLLSAFGAGGLVKPLEKLEEPILPDWAKSSGPPAGTPAVSVSQPDYVVVVHKGGKGETLSDVGQVFVIGGKRFDGNGYQHGEAFGKRFSFGYDAPTRVDIATKSGKKTSLTDAEKLIFCGGTEAPTKVSGDDEVVGWSDWDWRTVFYDPAGGLFRYMNQSADSPASQPQSQNAYWGQQRAAQQPFAASTRQRNQSGQQLQQALLAEKNARSAAMLAQAGLTPPALRAGAVSPVAPVIAPVAIAPLVFPQPDPNNPGFLTDGNLDPNYQAPSSVEGTQRSNQMSDDLELLGEQVLVEAAAATDDTDGDTGDTDEDVEGDMGRRGLTPGMAIVGELGRRGLTPGEALLGELGRRGLAPGEAMLGEMGRRGLVPGMAVMGEMGRRGLAPGMTLLGAHTAAYILGSDVVGAPLVTPRRSLQQAGFVIKKTPKGRTFTSLVINRQAQHSPKKTLASARAVAKRMNQIGQRSLTALSKMPMTSVKGASSRRPAPKMAPAALRRLAEGLIAGGKQLGETANKYEKSLGTLRQQQLASMKRAQAVTKVHGLVDVVGDDDDTASFEEIVGLAQEFLADSVEIMGGLGEAVPDPTNPGFLTDGTPDPNYGGAGAGVNAGTGTSPAVNMPGPPDYGAGPAPDINSAAPQPFLDYQPDPYPNGDDPSFYDAPTDDVLPLGAIVFDGSRQPAFQGFGNYTVFFGVMPDGTAPPKGGPNSGYEWHGSGGFDWALVLQGTQPSTGYSGGKNYDKVDQPGYAMVTESQKNNWGPLMGNPQGGWTRGLRFSPSGPNGPRWFWFFDKAPDWAKQPILQARLNDAIVAYQVAVAAGKTDFVNQQIQDQLDAQDAAKASKAQAAVDAQVAQQQEVEMQREAEAQARQAEQQSQLDLAAQQADMQYMQQQSQIDLQMQKQQADFYAAHPEMFAPPMQQQGAPSDDGGAFDGLPPEMSNEGSSGDEMLPTDLDDSQMDWDT